MLIYLNQALATSKARCEAESRGRSDLYEAIMEGVVDRVRPEMMTVVAIMAGLLPIMWSTDTDSEIMPRIAVPMIGDMISSTLLGRDSSDQRFSRRSRFSESPVKHESDRYLNMPTKVCK